MTLRFRYCARCWPVDIENYADGRCQECGHTLKSATAEEMVKLLWQQNDWLQEALSDAMDVMRQHGILGDKKRPILRLVHSRKEPRS